ncbi:T-lymphocyte surface antigen Ly-9-like [Platysternon megacephalum]|uniref:T-lymphocyte surface antigen Ly-9-like n=1 Tax=Platysternon megacephalum TaxID=55544 RepID=A0A4D9DLF5_9SAUR|nr:T-lymphocyte surface antigen Ly-9-like [Platysternon megacephalum]
MASDSCVCACAAQPVPEKMAPPLGSLRKKRIHAETRAPTAPTDLNSCAYSAPLRIDSTTWILRGS